MNRDNYNPKVLSRRKRQRWSWLESETTHRWEVYARRARRVHPEQRQALLKWAKRSCKKKKGTLQTNVRLTYVRSFKPVGVRMGGGRGRQRAKFGWSQPGKSLLSYLEVRSKPARRVERFFKRSNLRLKLVLRRL